jgi:SAM-dependent methyltransferase
MADFYREDGLNVRAYDARGSIDERSTRGDVAFLVRLLKPKDGPVLELGCGTGRVTIALARERFKVTGLDIARPMLARAREKTATEQNTVQRRLRWVEGDMTAFDLGEQFQAVVLMFRSFQMLLTPDDERACLLCAFQHLRPGGRLVVNIFDPLLEGLAPGPMEIAGLFGTRGTARDAVSGNAVDVEVVSHINHTLDQQLEETWRFIERDDDDHVVRVEEEVLRMRWLYRWEMRYLLELCGFEIEAEYSDYTGAPPAYGKEQIWVARRPA